MADVSTVREGQAAVESGADIIATTLSGYTPYSTGYDKNEPDWELLTGLVQTVNVPVILEGRIWTPEQARRAIGLGVYAVVVGTAITRPMLITRNFVEKLLLTNNMAGSG